MKRWTLVSRIGGVAAVAAFVVVLGSDEADAATQGPQVNVNVSASVSAACNVLTSSTMAFGVYASSLTTSTATINSQCTTGLYYTIAFDDGQNVVSAGGQRRMKGATTGALMNYGIYRDSGYATSLGNGVTNRLEHLTTDVDNMSYTIYGQIPAGQVLPADAYADVVVATIWY